MCIKDNITEQDIRKNIKNNSLFHFEILDETTSTNSVLKQKAINGEKEGYVLIANSQTEGKGRVGRKFFSYDNTGIYMSILLQPNISIEDITLITTAAACAVCRAIESLCDKEAQIKWVNDIYVDSKKVCGILTEGAINPQNALNEFAILGIGINVYKPKNDFDDEIKNIAGFIQESNQNGLKSKLIAQILNNFWEYYYNINSKPFYDYYKSKCFVLGKKVNIISLDKIIGSGTVTDLDKNFHLIIRDNFSNEQILSSGEVSIKIKE